MLNERSALNSDCRNVFRKVCYSFFGKNEHGYENGIQKISEITNTDIKKLSTSHRSQASIHIVNTLLRTDANARESIVAATSTSKGHIEILISDSPEAEVIRIAGIARDAIGQDNSKSIVAITPPSDVWLANAKKAFECFDIEFLDLLNSNQTDEVREIRT